MADYADEDMAQVGRDLMEEIAAHSEAWPLKGWGPMDTPAEVVTDMVNMATEMKANIERLEALLAVQQNRADQQAEWAIEEAKRAVEAERRIEQLEAQNKALRDALIHIEEYWNRDQNETAMANALWHIIDTASTALHEEPTDA